MPALRPPCRPKLPLRQKIRAWPLHPDPTRSRFRHQSSQVFMHRRDKHTDKRAEPLPGDGPPLGADGSEDAYARGATDPAGVEGSPSQASASGAVGSSAAAELEEQREKYLRLAAEFDN